MNLLLRRRQCLTISGAVLTATSLAGCGILHGTAATPSASVLAPGVQVQTSDGAPAPVTQRPPTIDECVTSAAKGTCGPYGAASTGIADGKITVGQDVWDPVPGWSQILHATTPGNWYVTANMPAKNIGVVSYPNVGETFGPHVSLADFSAIGSTFAEDMNATLYTKAWAAYDIWMNNWQNEVLIQNDYVDHGGCNVIATATFGGSGGMPTQTWNLCKWGGREIIWWLAGDTVQSGRVDILAMLNWLVDRGYLPGRSDLNSISYGWEICSTGGAPETFTISKFTLTLSQDSESRASG